MRSQRKLHCQDVPRCAKIPTKLPNVVRKVLSQIRKPCSNTSNSMVTLVNTLPELPCTILTVGLHSSLALLVVPLPTLELLGLFPEVLAMNIRSFL